MVKRIRGALLCLGLGLALTGCAAKSAGDYGAGLAMQWDGAPASAGWTEATLTAVMQTPLVGVVPSDITDWCPAYENQDALARAAFWSGALSALARYESSWNPAARGGGGRYIGVMQISPRTAGGAGCGGSLSNGQDNLVCAVKIAARKASSERSVAQILSDWGPMKQGDKRAAMAGWTSTQAYCAG